jgi:hypothetical protein
MATLTELLVGADTDGYEPFCDDLYNNLKNHWRRAAVRTTLTEAQAGMIGVDSANDTMWHCIAPGAPPTWRQIVQTTVPVLDDLNIFFGTDSDGSWKYDEATNDAIIVGVPVAPKRGIIYCRTADIAQNFTSLITASAQVRKYIIDADRDSVFAYGFYDDDIGLLTVPANPLRENMLTNSSFGVWSNSDANEGLATLVFDNKAGGNFAVGNTITGATSGATGKLITTNNATTMTLGAVSGTFQDNEQISNGVGVTADVNGDAAIGIKNDPMNNDSTGLWTDDGANITLAFVAAEYSVTTDAATQRAWITAAALTAGKLYKIELDIKDGTAATQQIEGYLNDGAAQYGAIKTTAAGWVSVFWTFECATTTAAGLVGFRIPVSLGALNIQIRRFSCYEITPCCTAADALAFDGWYKHTSVDIYRQHNDGGTLTKDGSFYSLKIVPLTDLVRVVCWPNGFSANEEWYQQFAGRTVTLGAWVKTSKASHAKLFMEDTGIGSLTYSTWHTGGGGWEWLEMTRNINATPTEFLCGIYVSQGGEVGGATIVYVSQPILCFSSSIGAGNYRPRQQESIWLEGIIESKLIKDDYSDVGWTDLNIEADSEGRISKRCKGFQAYLEVRDSGSSGVDCGIYFRASASLANLCACSCAGLTNNLIARTPMSFACDENGDVDYRIDASGVGTLDVGYFRYTHVQVN